MAVKANSLLGCDDITFLDFPDSNFSLIKEDDEQARRIVSIIDNKRVDYIFFPHILDYNLDHRSSSLLISKLLEGRPEIIKYYFCVWLWESLPNRDLKRITIDNIYYYSPRKNYKREAHDIYTTTHSSDGVYYSGSCPQLLYILTKRKKELFFLVKD